MNKRDKKLLIFHIESVIENCRDIQSEIRKNWRTRADEDAYLSIGDACEHLQSVIRHLK